MSLTVTQEAIQATRALRSRVTELHKDLLTATKNLATTFGENQQGLGAHSKSIQELLNDLDSEGNDSTEPVKKLTKKLKISADTRQAHLDKNTYTSKKR